MSIEELIAKLREPFPANVVNWKPQAVSKDKTKAMAVPFIDARDVQKRLDEACGTFGWQVKDTPFGDKVITSIGIKHPETGEWVWKDDVGFVAGEDSEKEDDQVKASKGTASDGLKRAAVVWGVFRYAYDVPKQWVAWDADNRRFAEKPVLPSWALPENERGRARNVSSDESDKKGEKSGQTTQSDPKQTESKPAYQRTHPPLSSVQKTKMIELWIALHSGAEGDAIKGLDKLFIESFKHGIEQATYEEGARLTGQLLAELREKPQGNAQSTEGAPKEKAALVESSNGQNKNSQSGSSQTTQAAQNVKTGECPTHHTPTVWFEKHQKWAHKIEGTKDWCYETPKG